MKILITLLLTLSSLAFAHQNSNYAYKLDGTYMLESSVIRPVKFSLQWNEEDGEVDGIYLDNYFARTTDIKGSAGENGRSFIVPLVKPITGVKSIHIMTAQTPRTESATTIPMSVITRDIKGNPLTTVEAEGQFIAMTAPARDLDEVSENINVRDAAQRREVAQREEVREIQKARKQQAVTERAQNKREANQKKAVQRQEQEAFCGEGFGELAGFCGLYAGMIAEDKDPGNKCNLLRSDAVRLELTTNGEFLLHLGRNPDVVIRPAHYIGRMRFNPQSNALDILSRSCRPLPDVNFLGDNCKILNLEGVLTRQKSGRHFEGAYIIVDEDSKLSCKYSLSLDMQAP